MASNDKTGTTDGAAEGSWSPRGDDVTSTKTDGGSSAKGSSGSAGPTDPDQLVREIEQTRENLAETLDAIVEKVNPKRVMEEKKQQARADAQEAVKTAKLGAATAAQSVKAAAVKGAEAVKDSAAKGAEAVKDGVATVKEKIGGDEDAVRSPLAPATSVEVDAAVPVDGVAPGPAPTTGALADRALVRTEPAGAETPSYASMVPPAVAANAPLIGGVGAALALLLVLLKRRRRKRC